MNKEEFMKEFDDWTKEEILSRSYNICIENISMRETLENISNYVKTCDYISQKVLLELLGEENE